MTQNSIEEVVLYAGREALVAEPDLGWILGIDRHTIELLIFLFKTTGLFAQLIAAVFVVFNTAPPVLCILSAVLAFIFGAVEGGASLLWKRRLQSGDMG